MQSQIIYQEPQEIGGHEVSSFVCDGYDGPCAVYSRSGKDKLICAFPDYVEAKKAALYASTPDGGNGSVLVAPCNASQVTHSEFLDWAF